jgi:hypothetical protein
MKKFELGKIYVDFTGYGCAYDRTDYAEYWRVEKKTDKSIWLSRATKVTEQWGTVMMTKDEALKIDPKKLTFTSARRFKLKVDYDYADYNNPTPDHEYVFSATDNTYINIKHLKELEEVK